MQDEIPGKQELAERALREMSSEEFLKLLDAASPEQLHAVARLGQSARVTSPLLRPFAEVLRAEPKSGLSSIVVGWESRRLLYNLLVGACGVPTLVLLLLGFHAPIAMLVAGTIGYGVAANVCYTLGSPAELLAWLMWREKSYQIGPVLWTMGTVFSMVLTLGVAFVISLVLFAGI